jgi:hypothetical protein
MRHSQTVRRLLALAALSALVIGTVGIGSPAAAVEPSNALFGGAMVEGGKTPMSSSGTRGMVDPMKLPRRAVDTVEQPAQLDLAWPKSAPTGPSVRQPASVLVAPDPEPYTPTTRPPAGQPGVDAFSFGAPDNDFQPPDPWVAVGPDHVIQTVNSSMQILDRSGNLIQSAALADFFELPAGRSNANPRVIFDSLHQRWVMTEISWHCDGTGGTGYIDYLVSSTADPTDPWRLEYQAYDGYMIDYMAPGTSTVNLAFAFNIFKFDPGANCFGAGFGYFGTAIVFADWAQVVKPPSAPPTVYDDYFFVGVSSEPKAFFGTRVAVQTPATSPTMHVVGQFDDPADGIGTGPVVPAYYAFSGSAAAMTVNVTSAADLTDEGVVSKFVQPVPPIQPGGVATVTTNIDSRPTDAIWQSNKLTWVSTGRCVPTGDVSTRDCVRVTQIDTSPAHMAVPPAPIQDFLIGAANTYHYVGGVGQALDGTLHVVWTRSTTTRYPSSYTAYQVRSDPDNSLSIPALLKAGVTPAFNGDEWGGYVGVAQDPQVPNAVWQGNAYSGGGPNWKTYISQLQTGGSSYVPIPPVRVLDTRPAYQIGLSGAFQANTPRTFAVGGSFGIPSNAIAVTGNVTVVNQSAGGYVSVTPTAVANPMSSTINFPLGDTRANNLTVTLAPNGKLAAVYKAPPGKTTQLIVDVTGYFLPGDEDATYSTVTPVRVLDTRPGFAIGLSGPFVPGTPRKLQVAGTHGIPGDATAITGNLTVVGQTKAGYLSITKTSVANPTTSTLNFPLGDTRANGVSVPLNLTGALWIVYKAAPGGTTHVILDVTGYYRDTPSGLLFYPLTPGRVLDSRPGAILTVAEGAFLANNPRRTDLAGRWGAPLSAQALTGNLTVVNQTAAGYVSATLTSEINPTTSVLNFPLGDTRANGVTLPLNVGGRTWFVYKAPSGKSTHLILDLSGYFN